MALEQDEYGDIKSGWEMENRAARLSLIPWDLALGLRSVRAVRHAAAAPSPQNHGRGGRYGQSWGGCLP
jgi:hypothetical protein